MKKSTVLKSIGLIGFCYLVFQISSVYFIFTRKKLPVKSKAENFIEEYQRLGIKLFLLEPNLLSQNNYSRETFFSLLEKRNYLTFGLIQDHQNKNLEEIFEEFQKRDFSVVSSVHSLGKEKQDVRSHIFLLHEDLTIHIVVFLKRTKDFLWTTLVSQIIQSKLDRILHFKLFVTDSYLFGRFELKEQYNILVPDHQFFHTLQSSRLLECNQTQARIFKTKYPQDEKEEARLFQRKARQIIARAKQYLDDLGIQFWLSSGTCLGWFRQCDIISYSKDVDFGIWIKDYKPELISVFEHGGFFLKHVFGKVSDSFELSFQAGDIKLDLFFFYEDETSMWNGGTHHETGQKYKYIFPKFSLCWTEFLEMYVRVPCPPQPYIEANYGTNWRKPVKDWEWNKSPPNVRENGFWDEHEWADVIQVF